MNSGLIAAATVGGSRGIIEYELRPWPGAATVAGIGLSVAFQVLADALALLAIILAERRRCGQARFGPN